jgi:polyisoprenoid-binding protein YceI
VTTDTTTRPAIEAGTWILDKAHTKIGFTAKHLMVSKVRGHFEDYDAKVEIADDLTESNVEVSLETASITSGTADRDNHLRSGDFLDVDSHPQLRFVSSEINGDGSDWKVTGDLTIRDVTRPITLDVTYEGSATDPWGNEHLGFTASARMNREDWGLTWNAALEGGGWLVSKDVVLEIEGELIRA